MSHHSVSFGAHPVQSFANRLRDHILNWLCSAEYDGDETAHTTAERLQIDITANRMYSHKTLSLRYTSYDVRHGEDTIHVGTDRRDIMLRAHETDARGHPFWYARVLGIYHVNVLYSGPNSTCRTQPRRMFFLHVRWFGRDLEQAPANSGPRLTRLGWDAANEFGFIDPEIVLRACHIVPAFAHGEVPHNGFARTAKPDWNWYYVMR